tara:strand:+ start:51 stop:554 length:504 start_codon:yes stop_codon:yes gene_type:complete
MATIALLGANSNIASNQGGDAFFAGNTGVGEAITRLPPVYANDGYSVNVSFTEATSGNAVTSVSIPANTNFTYSTGSNNVTITQQNDPFSVSYSCLMEDYTTQTFTTHTAALAASSPALLTLISLTIPNPITIEESHVFTTSSGNKTLNQANHFKAQSFISIVQALT